MRVAEALRLWLAWGVGLTFGIALVGGTIVGATCAACADSPDVSLIGGVFGTPLVLAGYVMAWLPLLAVPIALVSWIWLLVARRIPLMEYLPVLLVLLTLASTLGVVVACEAVLGWYGNDPVAFIPPFLIMWTPLVVPRIAVKQLRPGALVLVSRQPTNPALQPPQGRRS